MFNSSCACGVFQVQELGTISTAAAATQRQLVQAKGKIKKYAQIVEEAARATTAATTATEWFQESIKRLTNRLESYEYADSAVVLISFAPGCYLHDY